MYKRILVPTDGSSLSEQAVATAIDLALLAGAELVSVTVAHIQPYGYFEGSMVLNQREIEASQEQVEQSAQRLVDAVSPVRSRARATSDSGAATVETGMCFPPCFCPFRIRCRYSRGDEGRDRGTRSRR